ncbi:hypothetical protein COOONC_22383 [Cooperia oncophora]
MARSKELHRLKCILLVPFFLVQAVLYKSPIPLAVNSSSAARHVQLAAIIDGHKVVHLVNPDASVKTVAGDTGLGAARKPSPPGCLENELHESFCRQIEMHLVSGLVFLNSTDWRNSDCVRFDECPAFYKEAAEASEETTTETVTTVSESTNTDEKGLVITSAPINVSGEARAYTLSTFIEVSSLCPSVTMDVGGRSCATDGDCPVEQIWLQKTMSEFYPTPGRDAILPPGAAATGAATVLPETNRCSDPLKNYLNCGTKCPENVIVVFQLDVNDLNPSATCSLACVSGCFCRSPYILVDAKDPMDPLTRCVLPSECERKCSDPLKEFIVCGSSCPVGCDNRRPQSCTPCESGCFCKNGLVFLNSTDWRNSDCVRFDECPAFYKEAAEASEETTTETVTTVSESTNTDEKGLVITSGSIYFFC